MRRRLADLNARWIGSGGEDVTRTCDGSPVPRREGVAVGFDCPCGCGTRCCIMLANPLDGQPQVDASPGWQRTGETFDTLTLTPSIQRVGGCNWHGFVTNGEAHE